MIPVKKLNFLKTKIQKDCKSCMGDGCFECKKKATRLMNYAEAGIPIDYWLLPFSNFSGDPNFKKAVSAIIENINNIYSSGESLGFVGNLGTGKTYAACCILKKAIVSGYDAKYVNMSDVVNGLISKSSDNQEYLSELMNIDFLVIDEFDKRWVFPSEKVEQLFGQTLEHILRSRFQNQMPTILCSNTNNIDDVLSDEFSRAFSSLRQKYMKVFIVAGRDFRKCQ